MKTGLIIIAAFIISMGATNTFAQKTENPEKSVIEELDELTEKANVSTPQKILDAGKRGTEELRVSGILKTALNVGGRMPAFILEDAFGERINSADLLKKGHLVVVFYRGAWCPFCNLYLRGLQKRVPEFQSQGANLIAISVEPPDRSLAVSQKNNLNYTVLSDPELSVSRKFGIVYEMPKVTNDAILELGFDIAKYNNMEKTELPLSATYVINRSGIVEYAFLEPDYKKRADPDDLIMTLQKINGAAKADQPNK